MPKMVAHFCWQTDVGARNMGNMLSGGNRIPPVSSGLCACVRVRVLLVLALPNLTAEEGGGARSPVSRPGGGVPRVGPTISVSDQKRTMKLKRIPSQHNNHHNTIALVLEWPKFQQKKNFPPKASKGLETLNQKVDVVRCFSLGLRGWG